MSKHRFTHAQRYALFTVHGERCYLCTRPVDLQTMEVDHILPEELLGRPGELASTLRDFGLPSDFDLNSFANWLPACGPCNNRKRARLFTPSPRIQMELQIAIEKAGVAQALAEAIVHRQTLTKALNTIFRAAADGTLAHSDRAAICSLALFHVQQRADDVTAQPIQLTPGLTVLFEITFRGGCLDGKVVRGGTPEFDMNKSWWLLRTVGPLIGKAEEENRKLDNYLTWRQPAPEIVALAKVRGWSEDECQRRMKYHIYHVTDYEFTDTTVRFKAEFQDIE